MDINKIKVAIIHGCEQAAQESDSAKAKEWMSGAADLLDSLAHYEFAGCPTNSSSHPAPTEKS